MIMSQTDLHQLIKERQAVLGVIGLGYVGLPVACMFAQAGFSVIGLDIKADRVAMINAGRSPIEGNEPGLAELLENVIHQGNLRATNDYAELRQADMILIDVETPVDDQHKPQYVALKSACLSLGPVLKRGALVIVESTIAPGTIDQVVRPLLESTSGLRANIDFYVGACPERVMPGKLLKNLRSLSRVCGGSTPETAQAMVALYATIVKADLDATDPVTAELVKTAENAYRDVQIAFANEVALICQALGADVWRVRELVNKSPFRQMHLPGAGVGGHCIPKDPWLLASSVDNLVPLHLIPAARAVNDGMPAAVADLAVDELKKAAQPINQSRIAVLGYAYLENSDDTRNSPSESLVSLLEEIGAEVVVHDPFVPEYQGDLLEMVRGCHAAVLMVAHSEYKSLDLHALKAALRLPILIDGRGFFDATEARNAGLVYRCIGQGDSPLVK
jgi:UDP-N-acetyl-D-mannosaminuronic acid dehydrogenase